MHQPEAEPHAGSSLQSLGTNLPDPSKQNNAMNGHLLYNGYIDMENIHLFQIGQH